MPPRIPSYRPPGPPRPSAAARGYDHVWRNLAKKKKAANPYCEYCEEEIAAAGMTGIVGPELAVDVDHIDGNVRNRSWSNLKSTCRKHHNAKTKGRKWK